ncbi:MAG: sulfur carrier protein ThiS [Dactylosporangium sp.]|nr:sulfur carrier protein ThiS [Dactylosporangium sp.]
MRVTVNGAVREVPAGATVEGLLTEVVGPARAGIAVAVNRVVLPRPRWHQAVADGDEIEVLTAIQGG